MLRFALIVTALELVLTLGASLWVTFAEIHDSYFTDDDLKGLSIAFEKCDTQPRSQFTGLGYDTQATLKDPSQSLYLSVRSDVEAVEYDWRRLREEARRGKPDQGELSLIDEPIPGEQGYALRHRTAKSVRFELVRVRGRVMLIVRVSRQVPFDSLPSVEMSRCERRARVIQEHVMVKMRWRD